MDKLPQDREGGVTALPGSRGTGIIILHAEDDRRGEEF